MAKHSAMALVLVLVCAAAMAQDQARKRVQKAIEQYTSDSTLAVGVVEIDSQWIAGLQQTMSERFGAEGNRMANNPGFAMSRGFVEGFRAAGAREAVVIVGLHDLAMSTGPVAVITTENEQQARGVTELAQSLLRIGAGDLKELKAVTHEGYVLVGQQSTLDRYQKIASNGREELLAALEPMFAESNEMGRPSAVLVYSPGDEARRVLRALWPDMPAPFHELNGQLVGGGVNHVRANVTAPPEWQLEVVINSNSESDAKTIEELINTAWSKLAQQAVENNEIPELIAIVRRASMILAAAHEGTSVTMRATYDDAEVETFVESILLPGLHSARASAYRNQQMNHFKQLALGILNFESANKENWIPAAAAIVSAEGKPLLSWRVAILPYIDQQALFNEFRLDEPWDSPHNIQLARIVPSVYVDPAQPNLAAEGKTTYQVPVHPESVFPPLSEDTKVEEQTFLGKKLHLAKGTSYRDITDGTSNTVMIVQTPPENAVVWTRPADWEVDLAKAWRQLKGESSDGSTVSAFCDGSAHAWDHGEEQLEELLPKLITRDGGEEIEW